MIHNCCISGNESVEQAALKEDTSEQLLSGVSNRAASCAPRLSGSASFVVGMFILVYGVVPLVLKNGDVGVECMRGKGKGDVIGNESGSSGIRRVMHLDCPDIAALGDIR